ncbi:hypothetical protein DFA_11108 [Cavenderia fasciculata]|uniref:Bulb-type lectin domain-containing protein n=1 Tax=Cavenderia fasciculata TaxID=261658 RepID=F4QEY8_CACFS|nr:uncharacterized protein DFA_11108 [Cavenderia fasciculata]EGG13347.1 hypothetical protein DFA_11108 [Cavenderia fasciculata]|eukprot:XP_004350051.1 hypothetical protein DFA_11108 [Cavenderia fasciculata]
MWATDYAPPIVLSRWIHIYQEVVLYNKFDNMMKLIIFFFTIILSVVLGGNAKLDLTPGSYLTNTDPTKSTLQQGQSISSGGLYLTLGSDGHLYMTTVAVYGQPGAIQRWTTKGEVAYFYVPNQGGPFEFIFQNDGNLCAYDKSNNINAIWCYYTKGSGGIYLGISSTYMPLPAYALVMTTETDMVWARYANIAPVTQRNFGTSLIPGSWLSLNQTIYPGTSITNGYQTLKFQSSGSIQLYSNYGELGPNGRTAIWTHPVMLPWDGDYIWAQCSDPISDQLCAYSDGQSYGPVFQGTYLSMLPNDADPGHDFSILSFDDQWRVFMGFTRVPGQYTNYYSNSTNGFLQGALISNSVVNLQLTSTDLVLKNTNTQQVLWKTNTGCTGITYGNWNTKRWPTPTYPNAFCIYQPEGTVDQACWCANNMFGGNGRQRADTLVIPPGHACLLQISSTGKVLNTIYSI